MSENIRHAYRTCPCPSYDIEGIQTWLEDMAARGLILEADGAFLGVFTFQRSTPQKLIYRLIPVKVPQGIFSSTAEDPDPEEQDFSQACGWEYLVRYGQFYIYRATDPNARPLHTDAAVHDLALGALKKQQRSIFISELIWLLIWFGLGRFHYPSMFRSAIVIGLPYLISLIVFVVWVAASMLAFLLRLGQYQKRLRAGDSLDRPKNWKRRALLTRCGKLLPWICVLVFFCSWFSALTAADSGIPLTDYSADPPFAVLEDVFPEAEIDRKAGFLDYNTVIQYATALAENYEWNQEATVTTENGSYHCILRLEHHETAGEFWAKGLFRDYFLYDRLRYHGKRYESMDSPQTGFDEVAVYSSYGILYVLIRQGSAVTHASVTISQQGQSNQWQLWLDAMEEKCLP